MPVPRQYYNLGLSESENRTTQVHFSENDVGLDQLQRHFTKSMQHLLPESTMTMPPFAKRFLRVNCRCRVTEPKTLVLATVLSGCLLFAHSAIGQNSVYSDELELRISRLILRLGDANYSTRLSSQAELERIGVIALDQLHSASFHPDPQIASSARYIVQSNQFTWAWDTDPVAVRQILVNYGTAPHSEKSSYIDQLQRLEHEQGLPALCRLVRYETQSSLAKRAAMLLLRGKPLIDQSLEARKHLLHEGLIGGQSQASKWILKYASQEDEFDLLWWQQVLASEKSLLERRSGETNLELVADLNRWIIEQVVARSDLRPKALEIARALLVLGKTVKALDSAMGQDSARAEEFAQWALKHNLPEIVQEQHGKLSYTTASRNFIFGYYLAESFLLENKIDLAKKIAALTLIQTPCDEQGNVRSPVDTEKRDPLRMTLDAEFTRNANRDLSRRSVLADKLKERGHFDWAEAEYRFALYNQPKPIEKIGNPQEKPDAPKLSKPPQFDPNQIIEKQAVAQVDLTLDSNLYVMLHLSEMLHSQERHKDAAEVLEPFVLRFEKEPMFRRQLMDADSISEQILTSYYLYRGDDARKTGDSESAKAHYWNSISQSAENVDALIGLYKLTLPDQDQSSRRNKLKEIVQDLRTKIRNEEDNLRMSNGSEHAFFVRKLSNECNTLAWLLANTEGSQEEALFLSRKACALYPESAEYYDTLAHCYAAMGDFQNAVQQQRRALEIKPHHPELRKALARFEFLKTKSPGK
ncbi:MAG: hypothetical protein ABL921_23685 [Pirellula sp.]